MKLKERLRHHFHEVFKTKHSSHSIAAGFAIGTLIAILPTPGFGVFLGMLVILLFKRISKFALFLAFIVWNPITQIPIYFVSYNIGDFIFGSEPIVKFEMVFLNNVYNFTRRVLVGNILMAIIISTISYYVIFLIAKKYQKIF